MKDEDLALKIGEPTDLDKAVAEIMSKPLSTEELGGFVRVRHKLPNVHPYVKFSMPSKEDGRKDYSMEVGIKGTF